MKSDELLNENLKNRRVKTKNENGTSDTSESKANGSSQQTFQSNRSKKQEKQTSNNILFNSIFVVLFSVRTLSSYFNLIWDCDETYNYWEPLHYLLFGNGFQTWEYSPPYALRSYLYIILHALPLWSFRNMVASKITLFYALRFVMAFCATFLEYHLFKALRKHFAQVATFYLLFSMTSVAMFLSVTTFLPSTFAMYLVMLAYASWLNDSNATAIFSIALATLLGWPFAAILGVPIAFDLCFFKANKHTNQVNVLRNIVYFVFVSLLCGIFISVPLVLVDSYFFGKRVFAPLNIFMYNVFPSNPNQGPDLYGVEPFSFYIFNGVLNFNVLFPFALLAVLFLCVDYYRTRAKSTYKLLVIAIAMGLWCLVFFTRPHKEERFLYPIYPLILICSSAVLCLISSRLKEYYENKCNILCSFVSLVPSLIVVCHALLSLSRAIALYKNFSASFEIYTELNKPINKFIYPHLENSEQLNVCVSKEWYRFPSSFFIPEDINLPTKKQKWRLRYLESEFKGQLPGVYNEALQVPESTRFVDKKFNDENKEVRQRYVDIMKCHYFIDTDDQEENSSAYIQLSYKNKKTETKWKTLSQLRFLDSAHSENRLLRSFYVPYLYESSLKFTYFKLRVRMI